MYRNSEITFLTLIFQSDNKLMHATLPSGYDGYELYMNMKNMQVFS